MRHIRMATGTSSRAGNEDGVHALRFGAFEMDLRSGELRRGGTVVRLQPQPFKVLALLVDRPGEVVTRDEIQSRVWPAGTFVDFEQSLNFCIRQIRAALGDNALHPRYVETLPRRGYRWVGGSVERVTPPATVHEWPRPLSDRPADAESARASGEHDAVAGVRAGAALEGGGRGARSRRAPSRGPRLAFHLGGRPVGSPGAPSSSGSPSGGARSPRPASAPRARSSTSPRGRGSPSRWSS